MPGIGVVTVAATLVGIVFRAPLRWAFTAFVAAALLIPGHLAIPNTITGHLTVIRFVALGLLLRLIVDVRGGRLPISVFRFTRVHGALLVAAALAFIIGIGGAVAEVPLHTALVRWLTYVDPILILIVGLGAIRAIGDARWVATSMVVVLAAAAVIATIEHYVDWTGYANWWFGSRQPSFAANFLGHRGGPRSQAAAAFALEWAWLVAMLTPVTLAVVVDFRRHTARWLASLLPAGLVLAAVFAESRSVFVGFAVGALGLVVLTRADRRVTQVAVAGAVVGVIVWATIPALSRPFHLGRESAQASTEARIERLDEATTIVTERGREVEGLGLGGLNTFGITTVDNSYALAYIERGVVGVVVFGLVLLTALRAVLPALRAPPGRLRRLAAASVAGAAVALLGAAAYDLHELPQSLHVFWLLVALAIVIGESLPGRAAAAPRIRRPPVTLLVGLPVIAFIGGLMLNAHAPEHARGRWLFETVTLDEISTSRGDAVFGGRAVANTACTLAEGFGESRPSLDVECTHPEVGQGIGTIEVAGTNLEVTREGSAELFAHNRQILPGFRTHTLSAPRSGTATALRTAPLWAPLAMIGLLALLLDPRARSSSAHRHQHPVMPPERRTLA